MKRFNSILCSIIAVMLLMMTVSAHPGRTDANGGHWDRSNGTYHFHTGEYAGKSQSGDSSNSVYVPFTPPYDPPTENPYKQKDNSSTRRGKTHSEIIDLWFTAITTPAKEVTSKDMEYIVITLVVCVAITILLNIRNRKVHTDEMNRLAISYRGKENDLLKSRNEFLESKRKFEKYQQSEIKYIESQKAKFANPSTTSNNQISVAVLMQNSILFEHFKDTLTFKKISEGGALDYNRLYYYITDEAHNFKHKIDNISLTTTLSNTKSEKYQTTLNSCTCPYFTITLHKKEPCKHMYMLAYELMLLNGLSDKKIKSELKPYAEAYKELKLANKRSK